MLWLKLHDNGKLKFSKDRSSGYFTQTVVVWQITAPPNSRVGAADIRKNLKTNYFKWNRDMKMAKLDCLNIFKEKKKKKEIEKEKRQERRKKWTKKRNRKKRKRKRKKWKRREKMRQNQQGGEREQHLVLQEDDHWWPCSYHSVYIVIKRKTICIYLKDLRK